METIQELIDFCEAIPEEKWCIGQYEITVGEVVKRCFAGHLNHHLTGRAAHRGCFSLEPALTIIQPLGLSREELVSANNFAQVDNSPKQSVIKYLEDQKTGS